MTVSTEIYTTTHRIQGGMDPGTHGLFLLLNRPTESYLEVQNAQLTPLHEITKDSEPAPKLWLVKQEVVAVLVKARAELGPSSQTRAGYTKPFPHWVRINLDGYELKGHVQSGGRFEIGALLFEGETSFIPLFDAKLTAILFPRATAQAPALAFNRRMVNSISLLPRDEIPEEAQIT